MAFGLGFNKAKVLSAAEKYVQQGKLPNAIAEYEKILKNDPKDLTVLNTVGDLYARLGQNDEACNCFKNVGDAYAQQGFTVKAIAMYKKLTKMKPSLEGILKLAELYTQQGLFNDARQQYLQVAEEFLRAGELDQAVRIFQKTLEMDPENVAMKVRLAEVYVRLGKKNEAWQIFSGAAEQLRSRGQLAPAEDILQRMLTLDPTNTHALLMRGRNSLESGDAVAAIHYLQQVPDLDSQADGLKLLLQAYLAAERLTEAGVLATKLLTVHNDLDGISAFVDALMKGGLYQDALNVYHQYGDHLMAANQAKVLENLHAIIGHVRNEPESLELLLVLLQKAGETTHVGEITELLAHASVQKGDLEKARDLYQQLATMEPQNPVHQQNYEQVAARLGDKPKSGEITTEEGAVIVDELEATAPSMDQVYPDNIAAAVRAALTDAELFVSYNMPAKALGPLLATLPVAPLDVRINQRLAALHTRAGRFADAAACCRSLQKVYSEAGYAEEAGRYEELAKRYEERAGVSPAEAPSAEATAAAPWPTAAPAEAAIEPPPAEEPVPAEVVEVVEPEAEPVMEEAAVAADESEIDLSEEWEGALSEAPASAEAVEVVEPPQPVAQQAESAPPQEDLVPETVEEIRFYLQHGMRLQALAAMAKLEALSKDQDLITALRGEYEAAFAPAPIAEREPAPEAPVEEAPAEEVPAEETEVQEISEDEVPVHELSLGPLAPSQERVPTESELNQMVADLDVELGDLDDLPVSEPEPEPTQPIKAAAAPQHSGDTLGEFVADLEASLGDDFLPAPPAAKPAPEPVRPAPKTAPKPVSAPMPAMPTAPAAAASPKLAPSTLHRQPAEVAPSVAPAASRATAPSTDLVQMFDELRVELEEDATTTAAEQDPETHYNLGVAFREMGLLDEAIGELQKVCHITDRGLPFPQLMQTYTWLAQCFLDKGVPEAAIRWYERALKVSNIDEDTRTALHYELASAYENAKNKDAALNHFLEVYGTNIDYRDVSERIKALRS